MSKETLICDADEMSEYAIFGWTFEKNTPEGKAVLLRDNEDPEVKKFINQEMRYKSIKSKIKKLEKPEKPKGLSNGVKLLIAILFFPLGLLIYLYNPGKAEYESNLKDYTRSLKEYEEQLEEIRLSKQYQ